MDYVSGSAGVFLIRRAALCDPPKADMTAGFSGFMGSLVWWNVHALEESGMHFGSGWLILFAVVI